MAKAALVEIFASIQGEGRFVGEPTTFVRVATCPLRCLYCDTPYSYEAKGEFPVRVGDAEEPERNPVSAARAIELALRVAGEGNMRTATLSLTGGEPLVYPSFVREFGELARGAGHRVHLESAVHDVLALRKCVAVIDHLSADLKLPETLSDEAGHPTLVLEQNLACISEALEAGKTVDAKVVLTNEVSTSSLRNALRGLPEAAGLQLVLQPVTPFGEVTEPLGQELLAETCEVAHELGHRPLVLPQVHRVLGLP